MFYIKIPYLDLDQMYFTEQGENWFRFDSGQYMIQNGENVLYLEQGYGNMFTFHCSSDEFHYYWYEYFQCDKPYNSINYHVRNFKCDDTTYRRIGVRGSGIRMLRENKLQVFVREIFRQECGEFYQTDFDLFRVCAGYKQTKSAGKHGKFVYYTLRPTFDVYEDFSSIVDDIRKETPKARAKQRIAALKIIKGVLMAMYHGEFDGLERMKTDDILDMLMDYDLELETAQRIVNYAYGRQEFIFDDNMINIIEERYDGLKIFTRQYLRKEKRQAYLYALIKHDYDNPPLKGDELLWV